MPVATKKAIFCHIPKTGGTTVKAILDDLGLTVGIIDDHHDPMEPHSAIQSFCFVRHPVRWLNSVYYYSRKVAEENHERHPDSWWHLEYGGYLLERVTAAKDLNGFVQDVVTDWPGLVGEAFNHYVKTCTYVGRTERLIINLFEFLKMTGEKVSFADFRAHRGRREHVVGADQPQMSVESAVLILENETDLINRFRYHYVPDEVVNSAAS